MSLSLAFGLWLPAALAAEFEEYDFSRWSTEITQCDRLASHDRDPGHVAPGVTRENMDTELAIAACRDALQQDPDNPRLNYQLGRAYGYSDRGAEAMPYRLKAVAADYPQSLFVIGYLHLLGSTIDKDVCRARELWIRAARYRRLAALVALPTHELRGDFRDCGDPLVTQDLRDYLHEARRVSNDYYVGLLVDELLSKLSAR